MAWVITSALEPVYVDDPEWEVSMDCLMCDYYRHGKCTKQDRLDGTGKCYWDEVWATPEED